MTNLMKSNLSIEINECSVTFEHMSDSRTDVRYENISFADVMTV